MDSLRFGDGLILLTSTLKGGSAHFLTKTACLALSIKIKYHINFHASQSTLHLWKHPKAESAGKSAVAGGPLLWKIV